MSTKSIVFPDPEGAMSMILQGTDGTTSAPMRGCFVCHTACFATWIWRGLFDAIMGRAFTLLSNCLVALRKSAAPESITELLHLIHLPCALICSVCSPRNLIAERPSQSLLGGMRGDPLMLYTGIEKQTLVETKKKRKEN